MRAMWSGEIAFGLVTIPAKMYTATKDLTPTFTQLHTECGSKINYVRRCGTCARDVPWEEIGKGYEVSKGQYALFSKEELTTLEGDDAAVVAAHLPFGERVSRVAVQPRVVHADHSVLTLEPARDRQRVVALTDHTQLQRLEPAQEQPAVER